MLGIFRRRWPLIGACTIICLIAAGAYAFLQPKVYTSSTRLYATMSVGTSVNDAWQGGMAAQQRITSFAAFATGPEIARRVIERLRLNTTPGELEKRIHATFPPATTILDISVTDSDPAQAQRTADAVAGELMALVSEIETVVVEAPPNSRLRVVEPADMPSGPSSPAISKILVVGLLGGLVLGWLAAFAIESVRGAKSDSANGRSRPAPSLADGLTPVVIDRPGL